MIFFWHRQQKQELYYGAISEIFYSSKEMKTSLRFAFSRDLLPNFERSGVSEPGAPPAHAGPGVAVGRSADCSGLAHPASDIRWYRRLYASYPDIASALSLLNTTWGVGSPFSPATLCTKVVARRVI